MKFLGRDDDDLIAPMHGYVLGAFAADTPHELAETSLGILEKPTAGLTRKLGRGFVSSHTD